MVIILNKKTTWFLNMATLFARPSSGLCLWPGAFAGELSKVFSSTFLALMCWRKGGSWAFGSWWLLWTQKDRSKVLSNLQGTVATHVAWKRSIAFPSFESQILSFLSIKVWISWGGLLPTCGQYQTNILVKGLMGIMSEDDRRNYQGASSEFLSEYTLPSVSTLCV